MSFSPRHAEITSHPASFFSFLSFPIIIFLFLPLFLVLLFSSLSTKHCPYFYSCFAFLLPTIVCMSRMLAIPCRASLVCPVFSHSLPLQFGVSGLTRFDSLVRAALPSGSGTSVSDSTGYLARDRQGRFGDGDAANTRNCK